MTTSEATATIETLRENEAAVADRSRTRCQRYVVEEPGVCGLTEEQHRIARNLMDHRFDPGQRIEVPAGVSFLVPPVELTAEQADIIADVIEGQVSRHDRGRPVVIVLDGPGWTLLTAPERGLDTAR